MSVAYVNNTGSDIDAFHADIMAAINAGGVLPEHLADVFTLTRPCGVWLVNWA